MTGRVIGGFAAIIVLVFNGLPWECSLPSWLPDELPAEPPPEPPTLPPSPPATPPATPPPVTPPLVTPPPAIRPEPVPGRVAPTPEPPPRPQRAVTLPEEVVIRVLDTMRASFVRCFERARKLDPSLGTLKVLLHLDVDPTGAVIAVTTDTVLPKLSNCLSAIARQMKFPPPGEPAIVDVPLMH